MTETQSQPPAGGKPDPKRLEQELRDAFKDCYDPEIPVNIVDLGLIYGLEVNPEGDVHVDMTMTSAACPAAGMLVNQVETRAMEVPGVRSCRVEVTHDPPWNPSMISEEGQGELAILGINIPKY